MKFIDENGYITIPLYHGTSSIFLESIIQHGLGSPINELQYNIKLFKRICDAHNNTRWQSIWWRNNSYVWECMLHLKSSSTVNFRYGGTYLSPSQQNAAGYAQNNPYGSELLSSIIEAILDLETFDPDLAFKLIPTNHWIRNVMLQKYRPILLTIEKLKVSDLTTEKDNSTINLLKEIEGIAKKCPNIPTDILWSQFNFHCQKVIPIGKQDFEYLG